MLARAILKKPKVIILEDALDQFNLDETKEVINYLTDPKQPWGLVVVSSNDTWVKKCTKVVTLDKGQISNNK